MKNNIKTHKYCKILLITIFFVIVLLIVHTLKNYIIIQKMSNLSANVTADNYHLIWKTYNDNSIIVTDTYLKNDDYVQYNYIYLLDTQEKNKTTVISTNNTITAYYDSEKNFENLNDYSGLITPNSFKFIFPEENFINKIAFSFNTIIKSNTIKDIPCYEITFINNPNTKYFINKDTGLILYNINLGNNEKTSPSMQAMTYYFEDITDINKIININLSEYKEK